MCQKLTGGDREVDKTECEVKCEINHIDKDDKNCLVFFLLAIEDVKMDTNSTTLTRGQSRVCARTHVRLCAHTHTKFGVKFH